MADQREILALSATTKSAALGRIGCVSMDGRQPRWNILRWFVEIARSTKAYEEMVPAEFEMVSQEYMAVQEALLNGPGFEVKQFGLLPESLEKFRHELRLRLEELADVGYTSFGPFTVKRRVFLAEKRPVRKGKQVYGRDLVEHSRGQGLLYEMSRLLTEVGSAVRRCPHCRQVFLCSRGDAEYCSRQCQANAYARRQREVEKRKKLASTRRASRFKRKTRRKSVRTGS